MTMASKRPSSPSIKARQRNIIEGMATRDLTYTQAAKEFGVTRRQLKKFTTTKNLRSNYNRSPAYAKLYREGERKETRKVLGVRSIMRSDYKHLPITNTGQTPKEVRREQVKVMVRYLYYKNGHDRAEWAMYAREHHIPSSIDSIVILHKNDRIDDAKFGSILTNWAQIYNISNERFDAVAGDVNVEAF
jgi:hypothetical protein